MNYIVELSVTEKCNLACPYCYVANKDQFMSKETFDRVIDEIRYHEKAAGCSGVHISYFGGEPLLNWDLIRYAIPKVAELGWSQNIISNLTLLTPEIADYCTKHNVGFSWSFDGIGSNSSRPLLRIPENQGYTKILDLYNSKKDLLLSVSRGCKVMIYPGNYKTMTENFDFLMGWGISSPDFTIVRDAIWSEQDVEGFKVEARRLADRWMEKLREGIYCSIGFFTLYILDTAFGVLYGKRPFGCFSCTRGCSVSSTGDLYPCARFGAKGLLKYTRDHDYAYYQDMLDTRKRHACQQCELFSVCNAGCLYSELRNGNEPVPSMCNLLHILYAEAARITKEMKHNKTFCDMIANAMRRVG